MDPCNHSKRTDAIAAQKNFETFVRGAYKTWSTERLWLRRYVLYDLIMVENGSTLIQINPERQIANIQKYLNRAFDLYLKQDLNSATKDQLTRLKIVTEFCMQSKDFIEIISKANQLTEKYRKTDFFRQVV